MGRQGRRLQDVVCGQCGGIGQLMHRAAMAVGAGAAPRKEPAPPGRGSVQDTSDDKQGQPDETPLEWRYLEKVNDDQSFWLPQAPDDDPRPIDMSTLAHQPKK